MDKKYIAGQVAFTKPQMDQIEKARRALQVKLGIDLSRSQVICYIINQYLNTLNERSK